MAVLGRLVFRARDESRGDPADRPGLLAIGPGGVSTGPGAAAEARCFVDAARWGFRMAWSDAY